MSTKEISRETVKKEIETSVVTYEYTCDNCGTKEILTTSDNWARPKDWQWAYTNVTNKLLCKDCWEKRLENRKTTEFLDDVDLVRNILEHLESYYEYDGDDVNPSYYFEAEEVEDILTFLKESINDDSGN